MKIDKNDISKLCLNIVDKHMQNILDIVIKIVDTRPKNKYVVNHKSSYKEYIYVISMKAKELAALLQINPDMDVCIKEDIVINCYGDREPCYQEIKSIGIEKGKVLLFK